MGGSANATADGEHICVGHHQDLSDQFLVDLGHGYVGFREYWEAHPHSMIVKVPIDGGETEVVFEEHYWVGHINASPKLPNIITFCHEGPWNLVENRLWGLDIDTGETWKIRPSAPGEAFGHEYWMSDGEHIGPAAYRSFHKVARCDTSWRTKALISGQSLGIIDRDDQSAIARHPGTVIVDALS